MIDISLTLAVGGPLLSLYGLTVETEIPFPPGPNLSVDEDSPLVSIHVHRGLDAPTPDGPVVARIPCDVHGNDMVECRGPGGIWIWIHSFGTFRLRPGSVSIDVYPNADVDDQSLALVLAGPILLFARHQLGRPSLHASAIVTRCGAVGFLGSHGHGKSSVASTFLRHGSILLADDAMPLARRNGEIRSEPGPAYMKLWHETLEHGLGIDDDLPTVYRDIEKRLLTLDGRFPLAAGAERVYRLYLLDRYDPDTAGRTDIMIRSIPKREALLTLLTHTSMRPYLIPADDRFSLPVYADLVAQAAVRILSYPHGFEYQDAVHDRILEDLTAA